MLPPPPPFVRVPRRVRVRQPVCVRACTRMCEAECGSVWTRVDAVTCKPCKQGFEWSQLCVCAAVCVGLGGDLHRKESSSLFKLHTYGNSSRCMFFTCIRVLLRAERYELA
jgi:hypothetical protein